MGCLPFVLHECHTKVLQNGTKRVITKKIFLSITPEYGMFPINERSSGLQSNDTLLHCYSFGAFSLHTRNFIKV